MSPSSKQNKHVAIVTGGASGIGRAVAERMAREGVAIVVSDINEQEGRQAVERISEQGGQAVFQRADVASPEDNRKLVETAVETFGGLTMACNNAGIGGKQKPVADLPVESWQKVIDINLNGVFYAMKYQIPAMLESGGGSVVNMGSILSRVGFRNASAYVAAKHGLDGLTKTAAMEYAGQHIRVNTVGPAFIRTPLLTALDEDTLNQLAGLHPVQRLGSAEEVAALVYWLCSGEASFVTGSYYAIDGGYLAQ